MLHLAILISVVVAAAAVDLRMRRIPNALTVTGVVLGLVLGIVGGEGAQAVLGLVAALVVGFPFFAIGAIGAGDAKLLAAVGALLGPVPLVSVLVYGTIAGAVLALFWAARSGTIIPLFMRASDLVRYVLSFGRAGSRRTLESDGATAIPYGVAIAIGAVAAWFFPMFPQGLP